MKYLYLTKSVSDLYDENYALLIKEIKEGLNAKSWGKRSRGQASAQHSMNKKKSSTTCPLPYTLKELTMY